MKNQLLKAIAEMPSNAAYWMGRRDSYATTINETLSAATAASVQANDASLRNLYWWLDQCNDNFAGEMGWL